MPARLSEDARTAMLTSATAEARRRGDRRLGTEHLLLGLLHDPTSTAARALGVSLEDARGASAALDVAALAALGIEVREVGAGPPPSPGRRFPPFTSGARATLKRAVDEARLGAGRVETRHLLHALLALRPPDPAATLLEHLGVDPAVVRDRLDAFSDGESA